jgi:hypothetical protein
MLSMTKLTQGQTLTSTVTSVPFTPKANSVLVFVGTVANDSGYAPGNLTDSLSNIWSGEHIAFTNAGTVDMFRLDVGAAPASRTITYTAAHAGLAFVVYNLLGAESAAKLVGAKSSEAYSSTTMTLTRNNSMVVTGYSCKGTTNPTLPGGMPLVLDNSQSVGASFVSGIAHSLVQAIPDPAVSSTDFTSGFIVSNATNRTIAQWELLSSYLPDGPFWGQKAS